MAPGTAKTIEGVHRRKDGTSFPVEVRLTFDEEGGRPFVLALVRDISERKEMEASLIESRAAVETQEALRAREQYWRSITENSGDLISVTDLSGAIQYQSPSVRAILGYAPDERIGQEARNFTHPEDMATTGGAIAALLDDPHNVLRLETRVGHKAGHWVTLQAAFSILFDGAGAAAGIVLNARDITEQKQADEEIRRSQERLRSIMDNLPAAVFLKDEAGRYQVVNRTFEEWYGLEGGQAAGKVPSDFFSAEEASLYAAHDQAVLESGATIEEQRRVSYPDGAQRDVLINKFPVPGVGQGGRGVGAFNLDIGERLEAERAQRSSEKTKSDILNATPDSIFLIGPGEIVLEANEAGARRLGFAPADMIGKPLFELMPPDVAAKRRKFWATMIRDSAPTTLVDERDGTWFESIISPRFDERGTFLWASLIARDITKRIRMEDQLHEASKLDALGQLTGGFAHEFNNLLQAIMAGLSVLHNDLRGSDSQTRIPDLGDRAAHRGADLTRRLLTYVGKQDVRLEVADVAQLLDGAITVLRPILGESIAVLVDHEEALWQVTIDEAEMEGALFNLALNARDAMPDGSRLTLGASNVQFAPGGGAPGPWPEANGDYVRLSVSDTGSGMATDVIEHAFEPFFTTKDVGKGTGLGLSVVFGFITRQCGGHVQIESETGVGTSVIMYLPRAEGDLDASGAQLPESGPIAASGTVLLVEGDHEVLATLRIVINHLGFSVVAAADGREALAKIRGGETFDLVLTDVVMPGGFNGASLADEVKRLMPAAPVIMMSAYTADDLAKRGLLESDVHFLRKPFASDDLARLLTSVLGS